MITLFLLVVALVLLALGLVTSSAAWFFGSFCASAVAGWLLFRVSRARRPTGAEPAGYLVGTRSRHRGGSAIPATDPAGIEVWVVDGRPRYHWKRCEFIYGQDSAVITLIQAAEDGFIPCSLCEPPRLGAGQLTG